MRRCLILFALVSCHVGGFYAPKELEGTVPVLISNATPYAICSWHMTLADGSAPDPEWVKGVFKPDAQKRYDVKVKPGLYRLHAEACDHVFVLNENHVPVDGPLNILIRANKGGVFGDSASIGEVPNYHTRLIFARISGKQLQNEQDQLDAVRANTPDPATCRHVAQECGENIPPCCEGYSCHWIRGGENGGFGNYCEKI